MYHITRLGQLHPLSVFTKDKILETGKQGTNSSYKIPSYSLSHTLEVKITFKRYPHLFTVYVKMLDTVKVLC